MTSLEIALNNARLAQAATQLTLLQIAAGPDHTPDLREGLAWIFEDRPSSKPVACTTVAFARKFCADDPYYIWRKV